MYKRCYRLEYRVLGKTGLKVSILGFGGIPIANISEPDAINVVKKAFEVGVNYFHTSPTYGDSAIKIGKALKDVRDECILNVKIFGADRKRTEKGLRKALKMLRTDRIEIVQFRVTKEQFKKSLGENGGFKVLLRAQKEGVVSHIGITDHDPSFLAEAIKTGLFSNVIVPYNYVFREAERELLPLARSLDVGVTAMKPLGRGILVNVSEALNYIWEHNVATAIVGMKNIREVEENAKIGFKPAPLSDDQKKKLRFLAENLLRRYRIENGALIPKDIQK